MCIYLKNNPAKFHPNPILNNGTLALFEEHHPINNNKKKKNMTSRYGINSWFK